MHERVSYMVFDPKRLGERLLIFRRRKGMTQRELADASGVNHVSIARIERGQIPYVSVDVLVRLADALEASLDVLTGREDDSEIEAAVLALA
jgi:transcriptional regulator with XRE-family HTH domain